MISEEGLQAGTPHLLLMGGDSWSALTVSGNWQEASLERAAIESIHRLSVLEMLELVMVSLAQP